MILNDIVLETHEKLSNGSYLFDIVSIIQSYQMMNTASFYDAVRKKGMSLIGEMKKAAFNDGIIRPDFDLLQLTRQFNGVVDAISIPTEEKYFMGKPDYIRVVHEETDLPILRRDYIISPVQIFEAKELGASAVMFIASILDKMELQEFIKLAHGLKMDAVVEIYDERDLEKALRCGARIVAINNFDMRSEECDLNTTYRLRSLIPRDILVISQSGICTREQVVNLDLIDVDAVVIGRAFMEAADIRKKAGELLGRAV